MSTTQNSKCKACGSCGMPLEKAGDFALGDPNATLCHFCTDKNGKLLPYEKILAMNAQYYSESQGITLAAAAKLAEEFLKSQPAWKTG